ncbi:MAG: universal stress protein [Proteobacteria bacterium]|nr:universal stress protein [Pseudomonadota bacterium]
MNIKSIVVHVDDGVAVGDRVETAVRVAARFGSALTGVYLVATQEVTPTVAALLPPDAVSQRIAATGEAQERSEAAFRDGATGRVTAVEWRAPAGIAVEAAVANARYADLAILGQPQRDTDAFGFQQRVAESVLLQSGTPVLYIPYTGAPQSLGARVLVAWDGKRESARAIRDALPFLREASQVMIASYPRNTETADTLALAQPHLDAYLGRHGVRPVFRRHLGDDLEVGQRLLSQAADFGSDLLVMGGFAHSRAREWVLGGVTRTMLESMTLPVLMAR